MAGSGLRHEGKLGDLITAVIKRVALVGVFSVGASGGDIYSKKKKGA